MPRADFFTVEQLGPKQSITPEGFLLCEEVAAGRTGVMLYAAGEIAVEPGKDGIIRVVRDAADVFKPETIVSCTGKPVVDDHPEGGKMVDPTNWKLLACGTMLNPRRGPGIMDDLLLVDLLITDADAIKEVRGGKREVSLGYSAEYEQLEPGRARQFDIIVNHVALVEKGRCGPRCAIGDHAMPAKKPTWADGLKKRLLGLVPTKDAEAVEEAVQTALAESEAAADAGGGTLTPASQGGVTINLHAGMGGAGEPAGKDSAEANGNPNGAPVNGAGDEVPAWFKDFEGKLAQRLQGIDEFMKKTSDALMAKDAADPDKKDEVKDAADPDKKDEVKDAADPKDKTEDSTALVDEFRDTMARAEILAPGITLPTFDAKAKRGSTSDILCQLRRKALTAAHATADGKAILDRLGAGKMNFNDAATTCDAIKGTFIGASELMKVANNASPIKGDITRDGKTTKPPTIAEINDRNAKFWATQK